MIECPICGNRMLLSFAVNEDDSLRYERIACSACPTVIVDYGEPIVTIDDHPLTSDFCSEDSHTAPGRPDDNGQTDLFREVQGH